jgi:hypothetical protein
VDESGRLIAWLEASDVALRAPSERSHRTFARRRYVFRADDLTSGASLHEIALPELPGLMPAGACAAWLASARAETHRRAIDEVDRVLERYTFRRLHPDRTNEATPPDEERQAALELLRRPTDPKGDWSRLPPLSHATTQDDRPRPGTLFWTSTAQQDGRPITSSPLTAALRCKGEHQGMECSGPEALIVFRSKTRAVQLSWRVPSSDKSMVLCDQGTAASIHGISPQRRLVVLSESTGVFHQEGQSPDPDCHALSAAERYTVLRFDP